MNGYALLARRPQYRARHIIGANAPSRDSVYQFQGGILALLKAKDPRVSASEFGAMRDGVQKQTNASGEYGPLTKSAVAKFNSLYVTDSGTDLTQQTLDVLSIMVSSLKAAGAQQDADAKVQEQRQAEREAQRAADAKADADKKSAAEVKAEKTETKAANAETAVTTATTTPDLKAGSAQTVAVVKETKDNAATPEIKQEAVVLEKKAEEQQKKVDDAKTPEEMKKAIEGQKEVTGEVKDLAEKNRETLAGGSWLTRRAIGPVPGWAVVTVGGVTFLGLLALILGLTVGRRAVA